MIQLKQWQPDLQQTHIPPAEAEAKHYRLNPASRPAALTT